VRHFGVGNDSRKEDQTRFGYTPTTGGVRLDIEPTDKFTFGGSVDYHDVTTSSGRTAPSIEELFSPANTPGLELSNFRYIPARRARPSTGAGHSATPAVAVACARSSTISASKTMPCIRFSCSKEKCCS
jgi:hypothetical protein